MAVYTHLTRQDINQLLSHYNLGVVASFEGIEGGVENTNYFLEMNDHDQLQRYVLTIFESVSSVDVPFFVDFTDELHAHGLPVPNPVRDKTGQSIHFLKQKPSLIVPFFEGKHPDASEITLNQCQQVGEMLSKIHVVGQKSSLYQKNLRGLSWLDSQQKRLSVLLDSDDGTFMAEQWNNLSDSLNDFDHFPQGLIHGDLFHDNVLFDHNGKISGVIDFYQACNDWLIYDLAVTVNDWCLTGSGELNQTKMNAVLKAYTQIRSFTENERAAWPLMLRLAAFRFWISRLVTFVHPESEIAKESNTSAVRHFLNPDKFKNILILRNKLPDKMIEF